MSLPNTKTPPDSFPIAVAGPPATDSIYSPLRDATTQIRLLCPAGDDASLGIKYRLRIHDSKDVQGTYIAVSYTWGDATILKSLRINDCVINVRHNCWYALQQIKTYASSKPIWIDSICIDQSNEVEKGLQVSQMGAIYANARKVAACLGEGGPDMACFLEHVDNDDFSAKPFKPADFMTAYHHLANRPYFKRMWIVQECILAREMELFPGIKQPFDNSIWSKELEAFEELYRDSENHSKPAEQRLTNSLGELTIRYNGRLCFDLRDKIYAMLSLAPKAQQTRMSPDYTCSTLSTLLASTAVYTCVFAPSLSSDRYLYADRDDPDDADALTSLWPTVATSIFTLSKDFSGDLGFLKDLTAIRGQEGALPAFELLGIHLDERKLQLHTIDLGKGDVLILENWPSSKISSRIPSEDFQERADVPSSTGGRLIPSAESQLLSCFLDSHEEHPVKILTMLPNGQEFLVPLSTEPGDVLLQSDLHLHRQYKQLNFILCRNGIGVNYSIIGLAQFLDRDTDSTDTVLSGSLYSSKADALLELRVHPAVLTLMVLIVYVQVEFLDLPVLRCDGASSVKLREGSV